MQCVNAAIPLMEGEVEVNVGTGSDFWIPGYVRAEMRLSPTPSVFLTFPENPPAVVSSLYGPGQETLLRLPGGLGFRARTVRVELGQSASSTVRLLQMPVAVFKTGKDLLSVRFDIINFPTLYDSVTLTAAPWQIEIKPREQFREIVKQLESDGGYSLTHVGTVTRLHGQTFSADDAESLLLVLWWFLSFARGGSCGVGLASGIDEKGETAWKQWGCRSTFHWRGLTACLPRQNIHLWLPEAFTGFCRALKIDGPFNEDPLRPTLQWYLAANESRYPPTSIVLAQAALERLAFISLSKEDWKKYECKRGAGRRICAALEMASVNPGLPTACHKLTKFLNGRYQLGPRAIVDLRNSLVHRQSDSTASDGTYHEAAQLALRYVELLLLRHIGYEGEFVDRIAAHFEGNGRPKTVPWRSPGHPQRAGFHRHRSEYRKPMVG